jgi:hypothetical protein
MCAPIFGHLTGYIFVGEKTKVEKGHCRGVCWFPEGERRCPDDVGMAWAVGLNSGSFGICLTLAHWPNQHGMKPVKDFSTPSSGQLETAG